MPRADSTTTPQGRWVRSVLPQVCEACGEVIPRNTVFLFFAGMPKRVACQHCGMARPVEVAA